MCARHKGARSALGGVGRRARAGRRPQMEIVLAALVAAAVAVAVALLVQRPRAAHIAAGPLAAPERREAPPASGAAPVARSDEVQDELRVRREELARLEERLRARESSLELQAQQLAERE